MSRPDVVVLVHRLGPYHVARFSALRRECGMVVLELSSVDVTYGWDPVADAASFQRVTLLNDRDIDAVPAAEIKPRLFRALDQIDPSVIAIPGWYSTACLLALMWAKARGVPAIVMSESTERDFARSRIREAYKSTLVRQFDAALVGGQRQLQYLLKLGFPADAIALGYDVVDNEHFQNNLVTNSSGSLYFLASARFIEKKNLSFLISEYAAYCSTRGGQTWDLVLLGDGPGRPHLERLITELSLESRVRLPGFKQYAELPSFYHGAGAFIHAATSEQWGLVVNEAMAAGLPVLVSDACGCVDDLVHNGINGYRFDPYRPGQLSGMMKVVASDAELRGRMAKASREIISHWPARRFSEGVMFAAERARKAGAKGTLRGKMALSMAVALR